MLFKTTSQNITSFNPDLGAVLREQEELIEISINGANNTYVIAKEDEKLLQERVKDDVKKQMVFIAPLDNFLWDRQMILDLFNFHYRWEVYTPLKKRKFGYYVLPILYGDAFIGRIEPVLRKDRKLEIKGFWQEDSAMWNSEVWGVFYEALDKFKKYLNASDVVNSPKASDYV